ncbi:unnamed protein product [Lactuca virosa]|uniref:Membrane protein of ER body-like protein n=1 Tax=Lactuca virosa TaxID=75947 RepID=A0AAU9PWV4_9ASTR|nr:unnamed protein product [Lactuca virosa]
METTQAEHRWEDQEYDELEESLISRRKNLKQTPIFTTINDDFSSNNGGSVGVSNGEDQEKEEDEVKDLSQQNGIKVDEDDIEKEKQQTSEYLVYYDADKGIWKCRICSWDYEGNTCVTNHNQRICLFHETKDTGLRLQSSKGEANGVDSTFHGKIPMKDNINITIHNQENDFNIRIHNQENGNGLDFVINNQIGEHEKQNNLSDNCLHPSEISFEEVDKTESSEIEVIKDVEDEFDVETVIKKQETHDLFCPNCNSCITKRVILRKRKRKIPVPGEIAKRNKPETSNPSEVNLVSDDIQPLISNEDDHERDPDVFRCLSCFSIFMPSGNGFKLFGNKSNQENNQTSHNEVAVKESWFSRIFASNKVEQLNNQGSSTTTIIKMDLENGQVQSATVTVNQQQQYSNPIDSDIPTPSSVVNGDENALPSPQGFDTIKQPIAHESDNNVKESNGSHTTNGNMDLEKDQIESATPSVNRDYSASSAQGSNTFKQPIADESDNDVKESNDSQLADNTDGDQLVTSYHTEFNSQSDYPGMFVVKPPLNHVEPEQDFVFSHHPDGLTLHVPPNIGSLIIDNSQMNQLLDVTIQNNNPDLEIGSRAVEQSGETGGRSLDIVKSIVYGGLLEIIASLSVVASAVGADASTLNVLALGLANIFGGLLVISHDLWDLKNEGRGSSSSEEDRYQQLLGRRVDFPLHMLVSLLSYLLFGFLPPVVYGFSFRESNDKDFKLLTVAAASIVCIMILAAGKAYVQSQSLNRSYIKTIFYYMAFGFAVSGVSYMFGGLIMELLDTIGLFPPASGQVVNPSFPFHGAGADPTLIATY